MYFYYLGIIKILVTFQKGTNFSISNDPHHVLYIVGGFL